MEAAISPLELLHPDGVARLATVIGTGCPDRLRPHRPEPGAEEQADLVVIAPARAELGEPRWLEDAVERACTLLAADAVLYVLAPARPRRRIAALLEQKGIHTGTQLVHDPNDEDVRTIVPLSEGTARYAFTNLVATRPGRRRLVLQALRNRWSTRLLARLLPQIGLAGGRAGRRPQFEWLFALRGEEVDEPEGIVSVSWHGTSGALVVHGFAQGAGTPAIVAKVRPPAGGGVSAEADLIRRLGPGARAAGATVPQPLLVDVGTEREVLFEESLEGRTAAAVLGESPALLRSVTLRVGEWLENWNLDTRSEEHSSAGLLDRELREPASALARLLPDGERYLDWIETRCHSLASTAIPLVASHNDLTMVNVFVTSSGAIGIVDWEDARDRDLPLVDLYYSIVDATAATGRYADRVAAFGSLFGTGKRASMALELEQRLMRRLNLTPALAELAFQCCWLRQAAKEQHRNAAGPRPFLEILRLAAAAAGRAQPARS